MEVASAHRSSFSSLSASDQSVSEPSLPKLTSVSSLGCAEPDARSEEERCDGWPPTRRSVSSGAACSPGGTTAELPGSGAGCVVAATAGGKPTTGVGCCCGGCVRTPNGQSLELCSMCVLGLRSRSSDAIGVQRASVQRKNQPPLPLRHRAHPSSLQARRGKRVCTPFAL